MMNQPIPQRFEELKLKLRNIPHLPIPIKIDAVRLREEVESIPYPLLPYQSTFQEAHNHYQNVWKGISLISLDGQIYSDLHDGGDLEKTLGMYQKTGLTEYCPYAYEVLDQIGAGESRARILSIAPGGTLGWHSHNLELRQPEHLITMQIPIMMPKGFKYSVISYMDYRGSDFNTAPTVYEKHYEPGNVYIFNSYHYHNVFNHDATAERITLMCYVNLKNPKVFEVIEKAVEQYDGPVIESYDSYVNKMNTRLGINENSDIR